MHYILFDQHWGQYEFIALLRPEVTPADVIEWMTTWGQYDLEEGEGWEYGPSPIQPQLWGELYELEKVWEKGKYSSPLDTTLLGEWGRFTDEKGVTHLLFKKIKLEFSFDYDDEPSWLRYGSAYFSPVVLKAHK